MDQLYLNQKNIMAGSFNLSEEERLKLQNQKYILDDEGDNISHLNKHFGDLTALYWAWKNSKDEYVGMSQYRRFWDEDNLKNLLPLEEKTIYIPQPYEFGSVLQQYIECHGEYGIKKLKEYVKTKPMKLTDHLIDDLNNIYTIYPFNMMMCHKNLFDKVCETLFEILFDIYDSDMIEYINERSKLDEYQRRLPAFLSERILTLMYVHRKYFFGDDIDTRVVKMIYC